MYRLPRTTQPLGLPAPWTLPMPAPRLTGIYGMNDHVVAVDIGVVRVDRLEPDLVLGRGRETVHQLLERAALLHGTTDVFRLIYA